MSATAGNCLVTKRPVPVPENQIFSLALKIVSPNEQA